MLIKIIRNYQNIILVGIVAVCLFLLIAVASQGQYLRLSGDDFAFSNITSSHTVFGFFHTFLTTLSGRFTYALLVFILYQAPGLFIKLTPLLFVVLFIASFYVFARQLTKSNRKYVLLALSILFTFGLVMVPTNQYQTIHWLPAYISYGLALSLLLFHLAYLLKCVNHKLSFLNLSILFFGALFIGGLHEMVAIVGGFFIGIFGVALIINQVLLETWTKAKRILLSNVIIIIVPITGFIVAFIADFLLPATAYRKRYSVVPAESKLQTLTMGWRYSVDIFENTMREPILLFCFLASLLVSFLIYKNDRLRKPLQKIHPFAIQIFLLCLIVAPAAVLFIICVATRYGYGLQPPERTVFIFYFTLILAIFLAGMLFAALASTLSRRALYSSQATVLILITLTSPFMFCLYAKKTLSLHKTVNTQAQKYDAREDYIKESVSRGRRELRVESLPIGDTPYPKSNKNTFPNSAIAEYYGLEGLTAYNYPYEY